MASTEVEAKGSAQGGQPLQCLPLRHAGASASAAQHDRLHQARDGELALQGRCGGLVSTQAGHHLHSDTGIGQAANLLGDGAIEAGIPIVEPHHGFAGPGPIQHHLHYLLQREGAGAHLLTAIGRQGCDLGID